MGFLTYGEDHGIILFTLDPYFIFILNFLFYLQQYLFEDREVFSLNI